MPMDIPARSVGSRVNEPAAARRRWLILLGALALAFAFLGTRGLWDPDEGRYTNVALNMLDSGDWLNPKRNYEVGHWTKPPLTYWALASSFAAFGINTWAARLPSALAWLACVFLVWRTARRLQPGSEDEAAVVFATMLLPLAASQLVTTDSLLSCFELLAMWGFVEARFGPPASSRRWLLLTWCGTALAFLTKGPPALLPLLVMTGFDALTGLQGRQRLFRWTGLLLFLALALPWYLAVVIGNPGLLAYFIGDEVVNRVATNEFGRNGEWYGWLKVYLPTLLVGTLPWTRDFLVVLGQLPSRLRRWRRKQARATDASHLLPWLWLLLPLLVFCLAKSRLPLYLLPLFAPIALLIARHRRESGKALPHWPWLAGWALLLLGLKLAAAGLPSEKDASAWAREVAQRNDASTRKIVFVDDSPRYGLHLHLGRGVQVEKIAQLPHPKARFNPDYDEYIDIEIGESTNDRHAVWICKLEAWPDVRAALGARGLEAVQLGEPYHDRVMFRVVSMPSSSAAAMPSRRAATGG